VIPHNVAALQRLQDEVLIVPGTILLGSGVLRSERR
jgi:hypothetical protein